MVGVQMSRHIGLEKNQCPQFPYRLNLPCPGVPFDLIAGDAVEAQGVLGTAVFAVDVAHRFGQLARNQAQFGGDAQEGNVAKVAAESFMGVRMAEYQILDDEFDINEAARIVLDIEKVFAT